MNTLASKKVHLFTGCRDVPWAFQFLEKLAYSFLDEVKNCIFFLENKVVHFFPTRYTLLHLLFLKVQNWKFKEDIFTKKWYLKMILKPCPSSN